MDFGSYSDCGVVLAVDLVNTLDVESGDDDLEDVEQLQRLLARHEVTYPRAVTAGDVEDCRRLRERLRAIFTAADTSEAAAVLNALLLESRALPQLTEHDGELIHFHYTPQEVPVATKLAAETAMALGLILRDDRLERFKQCAAESCQDVFVDTSRNRSRRYCGEACNNRANVAAFRRRRRSAAGKSR